MKLDIISPGSIKIESSSGLSEQEVDKMVKDAEAHASEDKKTRDLIEARNKADSTIYQVEKSLKDYGDKLSDDDKKKIQEAIEKATKAKDLDDPADIDKAVEELLSASHKMAEEMYKEQASQQQAAGAGPEQASGAQTGGDNGGKSDEGAVDADFEVVDDEKEDKK